MLRLIVYYYHRACVARFGINIYPFNGIGWRAATRLFVKSICVFAFCKSKNTAMSVLLAELH